jgi:hypothetical protein
MWQWWIVEVWCLALRQAGAMDKVTALLFPIPQARDYRTSPIATKWQLLGWRFPREEDLRFSLARRGLIDAVHSTLRSTSHRVAKLQPHCVLRDVMMQCVVVCRTDDLRSVEPGLVTFASSGHGRVQGRREASEVAQVTQ